ncbi:hypothetical protein DCCM_4626 [Desulfocucumis palustris]|uniref:Uncharacterized protein n=1 Tax=Desulfocucumis palustris TaxID=1898651 RepID=A0A2L2XGK4_9FIRM|nr:hypothetical protein DCCM_4626 [Desulfocucumis palustris]
MEWGLPGGTQGSLIFDFSGGDECEILVWYGTPLLKAGNKIIKERIC